MFKTRKETCRNCGCEYVVTTQVEGQDVVERGKCKCECMHYKIVEKKKEAA